MRGLAFVTICAGLMVMVLWISAPASQVPQQYEGTIKKALEYLASKQLGQGNWATGPSNDTYPVSLTALAATALLMEGSSPGKGTYQKHLMLAKDWLMKMSQKNGPTDGLIGDPSHRNELRYMYGHAYAMTFLSSVYSQEKNPTTRSTLKDVLNRGVQFAAKAQGKSGGWFYTSNADGHDADDAGVSTTVLFALRICQKAGIDVPREVLTRSEAYLRNITGPNGGVYHSSRDKPEHPCMTAAALASLWNSDRLGEDLAKKWLKYCQSKIRLDAVMGPEAVRQSYDTETHYYFAHVIFRLSDDGWDKLFGPTAKGDGLTWSKYRSIVFGRLANAQDVDGSWSNHANGLGPVYTTAFFAMLMQLDKEALATFAR